MHIQIDGDYLRTLESRCRHVYTELANIRYAAGGFAASPPVAEAMRTFDGRWDQTRNEIADGLLALTDAITVIRNAFEETDQRLEISLYGGEA